MKRHEKNKVDSLWIASITIGLPILILIGLWEGIKGFGKGFWSYIIYIKEIIRAEPTE